MLKSSQSIRLVLVSLALIFLGYRACDEEDDGYSTTQSTSSGGHYRSYHGSSFSSGSSSHSGTSRGGFGSTGHSSS